MLRHPFCFSRKTYFARFFAELNEGSYGTRSKRLVLYGSLIPLQCLLHSIADEAPIALESLTVDYVRKRFKQDLVWQTEPTAEAAMNRSGVFRPAAVLIPLVVQEQGFASVTDSARCAFASSRRAN